MLETILFVTSAVCVIYFLIGVIPAMIHGGGVDTPVPILYYSGIHFTNCYINVPAVSYQVYFWFNYIGVIGS